VWRRSGHAADGVSEVGDSGAGFGAGVDFCWGDCSGIGGGDGLSGLADVLGLSDSADFGGAGGFRSFAD